MQRPLPVITASILLAAKSITLSYVAYGTGSAVHFSTLLQPLGFLSVALWLYLHPKTARWAVGAFFVFATFKQITVFPTFAGSTLDVIRRPFSMAIGAWLTWALLFGSGVRKYVRAGKEPNPDQITADPDERRSPLNL